MFTDEEKNLHRDCKRFKRGFMLLALLALCLGMPRLAAADVITDWNAIAIAAAATGQGPHLIAKGTGGQDWGTIGGQTPRAP